MRRCAAAAAWLSLLALPTHAFAQFSPGARSVGMAGAGMVFAKGVDAIEWNPANLALDETWNVSLGEVGAAGLLSGVTVGDLQEIFEAGGSGDAAVVDRLPASGLSFTTVSEGFATARAASAVDVPEPGSPLPSLGVSAGRFGLRVRSRVMAEASLSKELADLVVNGFDVAELQNYRVGDTRFRTTSFSEITGAYGTILGESLGIGVAARYVQGHSLAVGRIFEPVVDLFAETADISGVAVESPGGKGFGLDVGLALDLPMGVRASASATNVIQKMSWDDELVVHEAGLVVSRILCKSG